MTDAERLVELEIRYTQLEQQFHALSAVVYAQQRELDGAREMLIRLQSKLQGDPGLVESAQDEKPPHY